MPDDLVTPQPGNVAAPNRGVESVAECPVLPAVANGNQCAAVQESPQSSAAIWLRCQQEAEAIVAPNGEFIADRALRNQRISAAYASLWLRDNRFQWAGLAAFASKQVGCGMLNAVQIMDRSEDDIAAERDPDGFEWLFRKMLPAVVHVGAGYMRGRVSLGNLAVFLDIYPLHRFYELRGLANLKASLDERQSIKNQVKWPVKDEIFPFGKAFPQIADGFTLIERNDLLDSVRQLAFHEQVNVLQPVMYDDLLMRLGLDANQLAWASEVPGADFNEIQLTLAAQCAAKPSPVTTWFSNAPDAHLYNSSQRMEFVYRTAEQFDRLLNGKERRAIECSLEAICEGHGIR